MLQNNLHLLFLRLSAQQRATEYWVQKQENTVNTEAKQRT